MGKGWGWGKKRKAGLASGFHFPPRIHAMLFQSFHARGFSCFLLFTPGGRSFRVATLICPGLWVCRPFRAEKSARIKEILRQHSEKHKMLPLNDELVLRFKHILKKSPFPVPMRFNRNGEGTGMEPKKRIDRPVFWLPLTPSNSCIAFSRFTCSGTNYLCLLTPGCVRSALLPAVTDRLLLPEQRNPSDSTRFFVISTTFVTIFPLCACLQMRLARQEWGSKKVQKSRKEHPLTPPGSKSYSRYPAAFFLF